MACSISGCKEHNFHYNPLIEPLIKFHGKVIRTFDTLPKNGKVLEVVKRIAQVVAAPFAYLGLSMTALVGLCCNRHWKSTHSKKIAEIKSAKAKTKAEEEARVKAAEEEQRKAAEEARRRLELTEKIRRETVEGLDNPRFIQAMGGAEAVRAIPHIDRSWDGDPDMKWMTAPVMKYIKNDVTYFMFALYYLHPDPALKYFNKGVAILSWNNQDKYWQCPSPQGVPHDLLITPTHDSRVVLGSQEETKMIERIDHLISQEPVGFFVRKGTLSPAEEKAVEAQCTDLFLYDPRISEDLNWHAVLTKFPGCFL